MAIPVAAQLLTSFVNTEDLEGKRPDALRTPEMLAAWLHAQGLLTTLVPIDEAGWRRVREVRAALRALLLANNAVALPPTASATLNEATQRANIIIRLDEQGQAHLTPEAEGIDGALGQLLTRVFLMMAEGTWPRLKACRNEGCQFAFYDASKNRSCTWCSMATCGNRMKVSAYRQRLRGRERTPGVSTGQHGDTKDVAETEERIPTCSVSS